MVTLKSDVGCELIPAPAAIKSCLIIGAGVAGLQVLRHLRGLGRQVLILEANSDIGGVWQKNYVGYSLQVPWRLYQFPDFLWPKELQPKEEYPTGEQVQAYIRAYAAHFGLMRHVRLNCKLLRLRWKPDTRAWEALYCDKTRDGFFKITADFVVMSSGMYCNPFVPTYKNAESFAGLQLHAKDFTDMSVARGRRVVIVGAGKTALDCVGGLLASRCAASVTLLYRKAHWPVPRSVAGVPVRRLLFCRASTAMLSPYYTAGRAERALHWAAKPLKKLFWLGVQGAIASKFGAARKLKPSVSLPTDLFYGGQVLDDSMDELLEGDQVVTLRGEISSFVRDGVVLQDGSFRPADVILYCTGYEKSYECFDSATRALLGLQKDGLYLYRNCLPCAVSHLAFVGSEVSTYNNILTHSLQALWLAHVLTGGVKLPTREVMDADVRAQQRWRREVMPAQRSRGAVLMMYGMQYHDQLLTDMAVSPRRKGRNPLAECFGMYTAEDYVGLARHDAEAHDAARRAAARLYGDRPPPCASAASPPLTPSTPHLTKTAALTAALMARAAPTTAATAAAGGGACNVIHHRKHHHYYHHHHTLYDTLGLEDTWLTTGDWPYNTEPAPVLVDPSCGGSGVEGGVQGDDGGARDFSAAVSVSAAMAAAARGDGRHRGHWSAGPGSAPIRLSPMFDRHDAPWRQGHPVPASSSEEQNACWLPPPPPPQAARSRGIRSAESGVAASREPSFGAPPPPPRSPPTSTGRCASMTSEVTGVTARAVSVSAFATTATAKPVRSSMSAHYYRRSSRHDAVRRAIAAATATGLSGGGPLSGAASLQRRSSGGASRLSRVVFGPAASDSAGWFGHGGGGGGAHCKTAASSCASAATGCDAGRDASGSRPAGAYVIVGLHDICNQDPRWRPERSGCAVSVAPLDLRSRWSLPTAAPAASTAEEAAVAVVAAPPPLA